MPLKRNSEIILYMWFGVSDSVNQSTDPYLTMAAGGTAASCHSDETACWRHSLGCDEPQRSHSQPHSDWSGHSHGVPVLSVTHHQSAYITKYLFPVHVMHKVPRSCKQPSKGLNCQQAAPKILQATHHLSRQSTMKILQIWPRDEGMLTSHPAG